MLFAEDGVCFLLIILTRLLRRFNNRCADKKLFIVMSFSFLRFSRAIRIVYVVPAALLIVRSDKFLIVLTGMIFEAIIRSCRTEYLSIDIVLSINDIRTRFRTNNPR